MAGHKRLQMKVNSCWQVQLSGHREVAKYLPKPTKPKTTKPKSLPDKLTYLPEIFSGDWAIERRYISQKRKLLQDSIISLGAGD